MGGRVVGVGMVMGVALVCVRKGLRGSLQWHGACWAIASLQR